MANNVKTKDMAKVAIDGSDSDVKEFQKKAKGVDITLDFLPDVFISGEILQPRVSHYVKFPPNRTDQMHRATIADMIRQGQGEVKETEMQNFDFPDGKDDGRMQGHGLQQLEWADPAERYESEVATSKKISSALQKEAVERLEAAALKRAKEAEAARKAAETAAKPQATE